MNPERNDAGAEWISRTTGALGLLLVVAVLATFVAANTHLQWDLHAYRYAARAALAGLDPYRVENLALVAVRRWEMPFVYPPIGLVPFLPLASLSLPIAAALWMALKLATLVGLLVLWRRAFLPGVEWLVLALVALCAFDATVLWDLRAGNIALFEAALLWTAFACWLKGRRVAFAVLVVAAALFKLAPIVFLALLLVPVRGRRPPAALPIAAIAALAAFVALVAVPLLVGPAAAWHGFGSSLAGGRPQGAANPSAFAMLDLLVRVAFPTFRTFDTGFAAWICYLAAVVLLARRWLVRLWHEGDARAWVMAASLLYVLVHPRPMSYGYVMAIAPALWYAPAPFRSAPGRLAWALILSAQGLALLAHQQPPGLLLDHLPFLTVLVVFLFVVREQEAARIPVSRAAQGTTD